MGCSDKRLEYFTIKWRGGGVGNHHTFFFVFFLFLLFSPARACREIMSSYPSSQSSQSQSQYSASTTVVMETHAPFAATVLFACLQCQAHVECGIPASAGTTSGPHQVTARCYRCRSLIRLTLPQSSSTSTTTTTAYPRWNWIDNNNNNNNDDDDKASSNPGNRRMELLQASSSGGAATNATNPATTTRDSSSPTATAAVRNMDYYDLLGVPVESSQDQIKKAYYRLAMKFHPDRYQGDPARLSEHEEKVLPAPAPSCAVVYICADLSSNPASLIVYAPLCMLPYVLYLPACLPTFLPISWTFPSRHISYTNFQFKKISEAYQILSDPVLRGFHDEGGSASLTHLSTHARTHALIHPPLPPASHSFQPLDRRPLSPLRKRHGPAVGA